MKRKKSFIESDRFEVVADFLIGLVLLFISLLFLVGGYLLMPYTMDHTDYVFIFAMSIAFMVSLQIIFGAIYR